jgi:cytochrome c oxidase subunit IV
LAQHSAAVPDTHGGQVNDSGHPTELDYIKMGGMLLLATLIEIFCWYTIDSHALLIPILVILSITKFVTQAGYFMHLKFDQPALAWIFIGGMILALSIFIGVFALHYYDPIYEFLGNKVAAL